jgi:hypothetical protein
MLLYGHRFIASENFYHILDIDAIVNTPPNSTIYMDFSEKNLDIINHASTNNISFALGVVDVKELIYASSLGAKFIVVEKEFVKSAQLIAESYLFDAKILVKVDDEDEIEEFALLGIDGVVFTSAFIKITS